MSGRFYHFFRKGGNSTHISIKSEATEWYLFHKIRLISLFGWMEKEFIKYVLTRGPLRGVKRSKHETDKTFILKRAPRAY